MHLNDSLMRDLWIRLYVHALLRGSRVFPGLELCSGSPGYEPLGFTDIWKGRYHGSEVCIKTIRTPTNLEKIKRVRGPVHPRSEPNLHRLVPDLPPRSQRAQALFPPKHSSHTSGLGDAISVLCRKPVDAKWEHYAVHREESECKSANAGICLQDRQRRAANYIPNSLRKFAAASLISTGWTF